MRSLVLALPVFFFLAVLTCIPAVGYAVVWNVPADAPTIQAGIDSAVAGHDTVVVACGTYYEYNIQMRDGVYLTSETGEFDCVTVDAQQNGRVFTGSSLSKSFVIKGFTITGGVHTDRGGGMYLYRSSPQIINCHFTGNRLTDWNEQGVGLALWEQCDPEITGCVFSYNLATSPSNASGGGLYMYYYSDPVITNCTFYNNRAAPSGSQISVNTTSSLTMDNCILANGVDDDPIHCSSSTVTITCTDIHGNEMGDWVGCIAGMDSINNNFSEPPLFCDPGVKDFHLRDCSPCASAPGCGLVGALGLGGCTKTWEVPDEIPTIQAAIDTSCPGDTVLVADGTYPGSLMMKGGIHVLSESGDPESAIIDGEGSGCVTVFYGLSQTTYLEGFTITNGGALGGGGVYCFTCDPEITNCHIVDNQASDVGGGIYCVFSAAPVFRDCVIRNNRSLDKGGGCASTNQASPTFFNCTFFGNGAPQGGGIYVDSAYVDLQYSIISFGTEGSATYGNPGAVMNFQCCDIYGNPSGDFEAPLSADPEFCDTASYNFHLAASSPCLSDECGVIGAYGHGCFGESPVIADAGDVGNDQGRALRLTWERSIYDAPGDTVDITGYEIYRRQDEYLLDGRGAPAKMLGSPGIEPLLAGWDYVATVPAHGESLYQYIAPTLCDSTFFEGICWSVFFVRAATPDPFEYFDSRADSGYSIDNLAPGPPPSLVLVDPGTLVWEEVEDEDLFYYVVYGSDQPVLDESATLLFETPRTNQSVGGHVYDYYHVTAVDFSGNEGEEASVANPYAEVTPEDQPEITALMQNRPNPFEAATQVRFDLAEPGVVRIAVYDVTGELVRTLADQTWPAGRHSLTWEGDDARGKDAAPGIYFLRMEAAGFKATRKMMMLK